MAEIRVTCSNCGKVFYMQDYESKPCPNCGKVAVLWGQNEVGFVGY